MGQNQLPAEEFFDFKIKNEIPESGDRIQTLFHEKLKFYRMDSGFLQKAEGITSDSGKIISFS